MATITATAPTLAAVKTAVASANDGDTVICPTGVYDFGSGTTNLITITKNIVLRGQFLNVHPVKPTTVFEGIGSNGALLSWTTNSSNFTATLQSIAFHKESNTNGTGIAIGGTATVLPVNTTVGAGSANTNVASITTLSVASNTSLLSVGRVGVATSTGGAVLLYTGKSGSTQLTGCSLESGSGILALGGSVVQYQGGFRMTQCRVGAKAPDYTATIAAGSAGIDVATIGVGAGPTVLNVDSASGFPLPPGTGVKQINIQTTSAAGMAVISYTGAAGTQFTGCKLVKGTGNTQLGGAVKAWDGPGNTVVLIDDWVTGVIDHCWFDYEPGFPSSFRVIDINHGSAPGVVASSSNTFHTQAGDLIAPRRGEYSYSDEITYKFGGGPDLNGSHDGLYLEDNIITAENSFISFTDLGDDSKGGGRIIYRHNSGHCHVGSHGFGESGGIASMLFLESYNNHSCLVTNTPSYAAHAFRTGCGYIVNERIMNMGGGNNQNVFAIQIYRPQDAGTVQGVADGTNAFDLNARDNPLLVDKTTFRAITSDNGNAFSFVPLARTANENGFFQMGYRYAEGTNSLKLATQSIILKELGQSTDPINKWRGFSLRNDTVRTAQGHTDFYLSLLHTPIIYCAVITDSSWVNVGDPLGGTLGNSPIAGTKVTLAAGHDSQFNFTGGVSGSGGDTWSVRFIKKLHGAPGGGSIKTMNGGLVVQASNGTPNIPTVYPAYANSVGFGTFSAPPFNLGSPPTNPQWCGQAEVGIWTEDTKYRANVQASWVALVQQGPWSGSFLKLLGAMHNGLAPAGSQMIDTMANLGTLPKPAGGDSPANLRIGADWDSGTFGGPQGSAVPVSIPYNGVGAATHAYFYNYPYPLVSPVVSGPPPPTVVSTSATFTIGANNSFTVLTSGFSATPTFLTPPTFVSSPTGNALPAGVTFSSAGGFAGTATGAVVGQYVMAIQAINGSEQDTKNFTLTIQSGANALPTCSITKPANGANFSDTETVTINATAADVDGTVTQVKFRDTVSGVTTTLATQTVPPYTFQTSFAVGDHSLTVQATDDKGGVQASAAVLIHVTHVTPPLTAPDIVVIAG